MPVNVSQWRMDIGNFLNGTSNSLCDYVFYLSKNLMVIFYISYAVLSKDISILTLVCAIFLPFLGRRLLLLIFT